MIDYDPIPGWSGKQEAAPGRITITPAGLVTGTGAKPSGSTLRCEVRPGELTDTSGYLASRSEVWQQQPEPLDQDCWYEWAVQIPSGFTYDMSANPLWLSVAQWKGQRGGQPPLAIDVKQNWFRLGGSRANQGLIVKQNLGPIVPDRWTVFRVGVRWAVDGWLQVFRDGAEVLPRTALPMVDVIDGRPDAVYVKHGIYRDLGWTCGHVVNYGPLTVR